MARFARALSVSLSLVFLSAPVAQAAFIDFINQQPMNSHWGQANAGTTYFWSDHLAPQAANDYVMGTPYATGNLRTPEGSSSTFAGNSLTIHSGGSLLLKSNNNSRVYVVNDLILDGGGVTLGNGNRIFTLDGNITVLSASSIGTSDTDNRRLYLDAGIEGSGQLNLRLAAGAWIILGEDNSDFSGTWNITRTGTGGTQPYVDAQAAGSLGTGDVIVGAGVMLDIDYDREELSSNLVLNGLLTLDQALVFGSVTIGGTLLDPGVYSFTQLNTDFDAYLVNGGTGSITIPVLLVIPEPATLTLLALGGLGLLRRRKR
ncbi:MAG TPA: PEP-CTERM sorting domain-containing protein [Planctomycetota bacterium]|nr:PEP-CTERM sorting domain-containing protein [Planctomycetota bacterium]